MSKLKELLDNKPSKTIGVMVKSLRDVRSRTDFKVDMNTFGDFKGGICVGCAATTTLMEVTGVSFTRYTLYLRGSRLKAIQKELQIDYQELEAFETAIEDLRSNCVSSFLKYFDITDETARDLGRELEAEGLIPCWLENDYTEEHLAEYEKLASWLEDKGY